MQMLPEVFDALNEPVQNTCISGLLQRCKDFLKLSRTEMTKHYPDWDRHDAIYRGERPADDSDVKAAQRKEPMKMIVPLTYQQVQTFVAFCYQVYTQRDTIYELSGVSPADEVAAKVGQSLLERDIDYNRFRSEKLTQLLTDIGRFGVGITKHSWAHETVPIVDQVPDPNFQQTPGMPPTQPPMITQVTDATKFMGNKIIVVNPYRFFPDPRIPLTRFREGEFCGDEIEYGRGELEDMEKAGVCAGIEYVPAFRQEDLDGRRLIWIGKDPMLMYNNVPRFILVSELQMRINPSKFEFSPGKFLNPAIDREVKCLVWVANDSRIIRLEEMGYAHDEFTYDCAQFANDQIRFINFGLAEVLGPLQDTITWFINARVTSVRKVISNQLVVDPSGIEIKDLQDRNPVIRLKKSMVGTGVDRYITQLKVQDVTQGHLNDVNFLSNYARESTGITENLMGQFASGRRSSQEAKTVASNAAARLMLTAHGVWDSCLLPMGKKMLSNLRQGLDVPTLIKEIGPSAMMPMPVPGLAQGAIGFKQVTKQDLAGNYDFLIFDGTLPSQRGQTAMALQELLVGMLKEPQMIPLLGLDPKLLTFEVLDLRGVRNVQRFLLTPDRLAQLTAMAGQPNNGGTPGAPQGGPGHPPQPNSGGPAQQHGGHPPPGAINRGSPGAPPPQPVVGAHP